MHKILLHRLESQSETHANLVNNFSDLWLKAHIQHSICFIEHLQTHRQHEDTQICLGDEAITPTKSLTHQVSASL